MKDVHMQISLDLNDPWEEKPVRVRRGDTAKVLVIRLKKDKDPWPVPPDSLAVFTARKPDRTVLYNICEIREGVIFYPFTEQTVSCPGPMDAELKIYGGNRQLLTSAGFRMEVYDTLYQAEDAKKSQDEQNTLNALINQTLDVKNSTETLRQEVQSKLDRGELQGETAYKIALRLGFQGTEQQWMDSLRYDHSEEFTVLADQVRQDLTEARSAAQAAGQAASRAGSAESAALSHSEAAAGSAEAAKADAAAAVQAAQTATAQAGNAKSEADRAKKEADRAVESAGKSVSYEPQSLTPEQQKQARENISVPSNTEAVEAFCPPFEKTGPIVTCNPVTRIPYPIHVVSKIAPKQEGSGDPSPENVRPIVATDKVELVRCGKNFIDFFAKVYSDYDQLFDGFTKTINGLTVKINKGIAYISGKSTSDGWTNVINTSFNRTPTLPAGTYTLPSGLQLNLYSVSAHKLFQVTGSFTVKEPYNVDLVYIPVEKGSSPKFTKIPLSLAVGMTPAPYTPYTGETFTAQLPPDTVLLDWSEWRYKTSDGAWNDMEGQVPDIKPLPGENNLYSDTGDTTVSGREDPLHTITAMAKRITDLENHIEPLK